MMSTTTYPMGFEMNIEEVNRFLVSNYKVTQLPNYPIFPFSPAHLNQRHCLACQRELHFNPSAFSVDPFRRTIHLQLPRFL